MNDALERLRQRKRPTVPNRDTSLTSTSSDISTSRQQEHEISNFPDLSQTNDQLVGVQPSHGLASDSRDTQESRHLDSEISRQEVTALETKQTTLRLEADLSSRLQSMCRDREICREVLVEAMFEFCESNPDILEQIMPVAQQKNEHRQQLANLRRAQSMMKRFGSA